MTRSTSLRALPAARAAIVAALVVAGLVWPSHEVLAAQKSFPTPEAAASALVDAARAGNKAAILAILGTEASSLVTSGDAVQDDNARSGFVKDYDTKHSLTPDGAGDMQLVVGSEDWPLPIPIVKQGNVWRFDSAEGAQELVNRRIGRNELLTIRTLLSIGGAEQDYFQRQKDSTGTGTYAQHILSSDGATDGLYWPVDDGAAPSPLGPLVDEAKEEGYPGALAPDGKPLPYHGYFFRALTSQGDDAEGGARDYIKNGAMTGGFAFVAWPAQYGSTGITTFLLGPDDVVYQKDLGASTDKLAASMKSFDPDLSWARVDIKD